MFSFCHHRHHFQSPVIRSVLLYYFTLDLTLLHTDPKDKRFETGT